MTRERLYEILVAKRAAFEVLRMEDTVKHQEVMAVLELFRENKRLREENARLKARLDEPGGVR